MNCCSSPGVPPLRNSAPGNVRSVWLMAYSSAWRIHLTSNAICATGRQFLDWSADESPPVPMLKVRRRLGHGTGNLEPQNPLGSR
jgi:hypothetical protein